MRQMKREFNLAPSTIRHRAGALARCFDWMVRKHADIMAQNPLRLLKRGFSTYSDEDQRHLPTKARRESMILSAIADSMSTRKCASWKF
jgi:hypothetical protein